MTGWTDTSLALSTITDEGLFESLATDVLRRTVPAYAHLVHTGINASGKTRKAPIDGLAFEPGASPPHLVVAHHTTTSADQLERKWLHDPATVRKRKAGSPDAPQGDVLKSVEVIDRQRAGQPELHATLVLTTNTEPDENLVLNVQALCARHAIDVDIWTRTRLASVLDTAGDGQWVRRKYLGVPQQRLSAERLAELAAHSLDLAQPATAPAVWAKRQLDVELAAIRRPVTFLAGRSGSGKSVSCHRLARAHLADGGLALVLPADVIDSAATLERALDGALSQLDSGLAGDDSPLQWSTPGQPMLLIVEDINRTGHPVRLLEKIARWGLAALERKDSCRWRLICPTWPQITNAADHSLSKAVEGMPQFAGEMTPGEGAHAVELRAQAEGRTLAPSQALSIADSLGNDPLLIALYDFDETPTSAAVIHQYVARELRRLERTSGAMAVEYRSALRSLSRQLLKRLQFEPTVSQVLESCSCEQQARRLRELIRQGTVLCQQAGPEIDPVLRFRHDRVRDWLFVDALSYADTQAPLEIDAVEDPFIAEIVGSVLAQRQVPERTLTVVASAAPLALFHALRTLQPGSVEPRRRLLAAINAWLTGLNGESAGQQNLLWECLSALAGTDDPCVPELVRAIPYPHIVGLAAAVRNGDVMSGAALCERLEPGINASFRDLQIEHARHALGDAFVAAINEALRPTIEASDHHYPSGLLRLAGHVGIPALGPSLMERWNGDSRRAERLQDYLWALARCCTEDTAELYLKPIVDMWAALPVEKDSHGTSARNSFALYSVDWAFARTPPTNALSYLVQRAQSEDLRWPIMYMLRGVRGDCVLDMLRDELTRRYAENADSAFMFCNTIFRFGDRASRLPEGYRAKLSEIWNEPSNTDATRRAAFSMWRLGADLRDVGILLKSGVEASWEEQILRERLICGDRSALPRLIERLVPSSDANPWWWRYAENFIGSEILGCLDRSLKWRRDHPECAERLGLDWYIARVMRRYSPLSIESLLVAHWDHLATAPEFALTALFAATERTKRLAAVAINTLSEPARVFKFITMAYGIKEQGCAGVTRREQIEALEPYVHLISHLDLTWLAEECSRLGWSDVRSRVLGAALAALPSAWTREKAFDILDKLAADPNRWVRREVDELLQVHVSWTELAAELERWLQSRRSIEALSFVAEAIEYKGSRTDLGMLFPLDGNDGPLSRKIIDNTAFSVRRRVS